jgi:hypothetical protein
MLNKLYCREVVTLFSGSLMVIEEIVKNVPPIVTVNAYTMQVSTDCIVKCSLIRAMMPMSRYAIKTTNNRHDTTTSVKKASPLANVPVRNRRNI